MTTVSNDACINYIHFLDTVDVYTSNTGKSLPYSELDVTVGFLGVFNFLLPKVLGIPSIPDAILSVPFAPYKYVIVPSGYHMSSNTAKHEFAHTLRHVFDGSLSHWVDDLRRYVYAQHHSCSSVKNEGFAFNEGFANWNYGSTCGDANGPMNMEGNVAQALKELQRSCGLTYKDMWAVLEANPGVIHTFDTFRAKACPPPVATAPPPTAATPTSAVFAACSTRPTLQFFSGYTSHGQGHLQSAVRDLQNLLNKNGASLDADGFFGESTNADVRAYQAAHGLQVDGIVGSATWASLCA